jgi:sugar transferase EpsL
MRGMGDGDFVKRALDLAGAIVGLAVTAPVIAIAAAAVRLRMGRPVFYRQARPGFQGRLFTLVKLRTMREPGDGGWVPDEDRLTRLGRFLRRTSLDELPELWNVLKGEMSLVGPRPLLPEYLPLFSPEQSRRHEVKPGLTGWAQVNGRNAQSWEDRLAMDVWYVENRTLALDLRILWMTAGQVLRGSGVHAVTGEIMPRFTGTGAHQGNTHADRQLPPDE